MESEDSPFLFKGSPPDGVREVKGREKVQIAEVLSKKDADQKSSSSEEEEENDLSKSAESLLLEHFGSEDGLHDIKEETKLPDLSDQEPGEALLSEERCESVCVIETEEDQNLSDRESEKASRSTTPEKLNFKQVENVIEITAPSLQSLELVKQVEPETKEINPQEREKVFKENQVLKARLMEIDEQLQVSRKEMENLQTELQTKSSENLNLESQKLQLQQQVDSAKNNLDNLNLQYKQLVASNDDKNEQLLQKQKDIDEFEIKVRDLTEKVQKLSTVDPVEGSSTNGLGRERSHIQGKSRTSLRSNNETKSTPRRSKSKICVIL